MTETRTDHAAEALRLLKPKEVNYGHWENAPLAAQTHALLALVEQQRETAIALKRVADALEADSNLRFAQAEMGGQITVKP